MCVPAGVGVVALAREWFVQTGSPCQCEHELLATTHQAWRCVELMGGCVEVLGGCVALLGGCVEVSDASHRAAVHMQEAHDASIKLGVNVPMHGYAIDCCACW